MQNRTKKISWRRLRIGQEISGVEYIRDGMRCTSSFTGYIRSKNMHEVTVAMWRPDNESTTSYPSDTAKFEIPMTDAEFRRNHNAKARIAVAALKNKLSDYEIGCHEMANGWIETSPWELAANLKQYRYSLIGVCYDIPPKHAMFSDDILDVGICAEDEDHDRFWCHFRSQDVNRIIHLQEAYENCENKAQFDEHKAHYDYLKSLEKEGGNK